MAENLDLIIRGGIVVSEGESYKADVGIKDGVITALGKIDAESPIERHSGNRRFRKIRIAWYHRLPRALPPARF